MWRCILCCLAIFSLHAGPFKKTPPPPVAPTPPPEQPVQPQPTLASLEKKSYWMHHQSASVGYRRDRQSFSEPNSKQSVSNRNSLELLLGSHLEYNHFVVYVQGRYGWLASGDYDYSETGTTFGEPLDFSRFDLGAGYTNDVMGAIGVQFKFLDCPNLTIAFVPFGGYKYSHLMNFPRGEKRYTIPNEPALLAAGTSGFALARVPEPNQQDWFGPFAEARLKVLFLKNYEIYLFYQYHKPTMRSKSKEEIDLYLFNPPTTATAIDLFRASTIYKARSATKQLGGVDFKYHGTGGWNFGTHFEGSSAWSHKARYLSKKTREQYILAPTGVTAIYADETASIHWVCYELSVSLGYQF